MELNTSELKDKFIVDKKYGLIVPSNLEEIDNSLLKEMYKYDEDEPIISSVEIDGTKKEQEKMYDLISDYYNHDEEDYQRMIGESLTGRIVF